MRGIVGAFLALFVVLAGPVSAQTEDRIEAVASDYVELVLGVNLIFDVPMDSLDPSLAPGLQAAREAARDPAEIAAGARTLIARLDALPAEDDALAAMRRRALRARLDFMDVALRGPDAPRLDLIEDTRRRFGFEPVFAPLSAFDPIIEQLEQDMPGDGALAERITEMRAAASVPPDRIEAVFNAALDECRRRSAPYFDLSDESVEVQFTDDDLTPAQALYQGGGRTIVRISRTIPTDVDRLLVHACHEAYPGHHLHFTAMDRVLFRRNGWAEYGAGLDADPLFAGAEAVAEYGVGLAFPVEERVAFLRDVLMPLAGKRMEHEAQWRAFLTARPRLLGSSATIAGEVLSGRIDAETGQQLLVRYRLQSPQAASQTMRMISAFGGGLIASDLGWAAVEQAMAGRSIEERWRLLRRIQEQPMLLSDVQALADD
jgi:hypothetical protein